MLFNHNNSYAFSFRTTVLFELIYFRYTIITNGSFRIFIFIETSIGFDVFPRAVDIRPTLARAHPRTTVSPPLTERRPSVNANLRPSVAVSRTFGVPTRGAIVLGSAASPAAAAVGTFCRSAAAPRRSTSFSDPLRGRRRNSS